MNQFVISVGRHEVACSRSLDAALDTLKHLERGRVKIRFKVGEGTLVLSRFTYLLNSTFKLDYYPKGIV